MSWSRLTTARYADPTVKPEQRVNHDNRPTGPEVVCPVCRATVRLTTPTASIRPAGVAKGEQVIQRHRPGGGRVLIRRGDVPCLGSPL